MRPRRRIYLLILLLVVGLYFFGQLLVSYVFSIWDRVHVENNLSASFHRPVHLGKISWRIGIRGLAFDTDEIAIQDKDNQPFFHSNKTTIIFGFISLLHGKLLITHLDMLEPQAWLKRLDRSEWNFSDLPQSEAFSNFADCKVIDGQVHLIDERKDSNLSCANTDLQYIQLQTHRIFGQYFWPFKLTAQIVQTKNICSIAMDGFGVGSLNQWLNCRYAFSLDAHNFKPKCLASFLDSVPKTEGSLDLKIKGRCIPSQKFEGTAEIKTDKFIVTPVGLEPIKILNTDLYSQVSLDKNLISWKDLKIKVGTSEFQSEGKINGWLSTSPSYKAKIDGNTERLEKLLNNIDIPSLTTNLKSLPSDFSCAGRIELTGLIASDKLNKKFNSDIILHNVSIQLKDRQLSLNGIEGAINSNEGGLHIKQVKALLNRSQLEVSAEITNSAKDSIQLKGASVAVDDIRKLATMIHIPAYLNNLNIQGNIKTINIVIHGGTKNTHVNFSMRPAGLAWNGPDGQHVLKINEGLISGDDNDIELDKVSGILGTGRFLVDGYVGTNPAASSKIVLDGEHFDLASVNSLIQASGIKLPYLSSLDGKIAKVNIRFVGKTNSNDYFIASLVPEDLIYKPADAIAAVHLAGGIINYDNDTLTLSNISVNLAKSQCVLNAKIGNWSGQQKFEDIRIEGAKFDLKEISDCLTAKKNSAVLYQPFVALMDSWGISQLEGTVDGSLAIEKANNDRLVMNLSVTSIQFKKSGQIVRISGDNLAINKNGDLNIQELKLTSGNNNLTVSGNARDLHGSSGSNTHLKVQGQIYYHDLASMFSWPSADWLDDRPIPVQAWVNDWRLQNLSCVIGTSRIILDQIPFQMAGTINFENAPHVEIRTWIHDPIPVQKIVDILNPKQTNIDFGQTTGTIRGGMHINGPIGGPNVTAGCRILGCDLPKLAIFNVNGLVKLVIPSITSTKINNNPVITFDFDTAKFGIVPFKKLNGKAIYNSSQTPPSVELQDLQANIAGGALTGSARFDISDQLPFTITNKVKAIDINELAKELGGKPDELEGLADIELNLNGNASTKQKLTQSLSGSGNFQASNGRIEQLRPLQVKLEEANVLEQGIIGFRVSNVLGIVETKGNGAFVSASGQFEIDKGVVKLENLVFNGAELKLQSIGKIDLNTNKIALHTTGDIMHVGDQGALGKVASLSVASLADLVSKEVRPKAQAPFSTHPFSFDINGDLTQPNTIGDSIGKSFHWQTSSTQSATVRR